MSDSTFITRVTLTNYKSIAQCQVDLGPLMFLVGPNGAGKSNFLDALRFVADALSTTLDNAIRQRHGFNQVMRRVSAQFSSVRSFGIRLDFRLPEGATGCYEFQIGSRLKGGYEVQHEECLIRSGSNPELQSFYRLQNGAVNSSESPMPAVTADRLYLVAASGIPAFRPVFDACSRMAFYNPSPTYIHYPGTSEAGEVLTRFGENIASVLHRIKDHSPAIKQRIEAYLAAVVPGVVGVDIQDHGSIEILEFRQRASGLKKSLSFPATSMSDGTLRALGILVALFQDGNGTGMRIPLVGIEEPEVALHPAAVGVLLDSLTEASQSKQIIITSHSPDLLDNDRIAPESLLAVTAEEGVTTIGPIDDAGRTLLRDRLYTAGELMRLNQLSPHRNGAIRRSKHPGGNVK
jgi:predicted ATPase